MLLALRHPVALVGLLVGVAVALLVRRYGHRLAARALSLPGPPRQSGVTDVVDPYGIIGLLLSGAAWGPAWTPGFAARRRRVRTIVALLVGPVLAVAAGMGLLALYLGLGGQAYLLHDAPIVAIMHGSGMPSGEALTTIPYAAGIAAVVTGLIALVPLPPLDGFQVVLLLIPAGARRDRVELALVEHNWGVLALLVLAILPIAGQPILLSLVGLVAAPLVGVLGGGG